MSAVDLAWRNEGLCGQIGADGFFPDDGGLNPFAAATCAACQVRTNCLEYALNAREEWGIWGGTTPSQRKKMLRKSGRAAA